MLPPSADIVRMTIVEMPPSCWRVRHAVASTIPNAAAAQPGGGLWRDPLAWQVTAFMGLQSSLAYIVFGWLPAALVDRGFDIVAAGLVASVSALAQGVLALLVPTLAARRPDQRPWVILVIALPLVGFTGLLVGPIALAWGFALLLGAGVSAAAGLPGWGKLIQDLERHYDVPSPGAELDISLTDRAELIERVDAVTPEAVSAFADTAPKVPAPSAATASG